MWYNICVKYKKQPQNKHSIKQGRLPVFFADMLNICDPVSAFDELMEEVNIKRYLPERPYGKKGRRGYNRVNMLKTVTYMLSCTNLGVIWHNRFFYAVILHCFFDAVHLNFYRTVLPIIELQIIVRSQIWERTLSYVGYIAEELTPRNHRLSLFLILICN